MDISEPIWEAVAELELQHYTKKEISEALENVSDEIESTLDDGTMGK
jgi:hypothetical protein